MLLASSWDIKEPGSLIFFKLMCNSKRVAYLISGINIMFSEIVRRVSTVEEPPFRPTVPERMCESQWLEIMTECWLEQPELRPTFGRIKLDLKKINGGR